MPKVSVIIPVYNSEQYLSRCLDSVEEQTLSDLEIICVDDYSTDSSRNILEEYTKRDKRIRVLYNDKNLGQAFSRNRALDVAEGEYIQFLDSDDYLNGADVLDSLYTISRDHKLDLLKSEWYIVENKSIRMQEKYPEYIIDKICSGKELFWGLESHNVWARLTVSNFVRRYFINEHRIRFFDGIIHEDILYSYELYYYAERAMCTNLCTYYYIKHQNTTTTRQKDISHIRGHLVCANEIIRKDLRDAPMEFRYATLKYFIRIYNEIFAILKELKYSITPQMFDGELQKLFQMLWDKGDKVYVNKKIIVQNIDMIAQSEKIYIYGAGKAAKELLEILAEYDISIDGIFVTDIKKSPRTLMGHKVFSIDACNDNKEKSLFLVAITKMYVGNVVDLLHSRGYGNVLYVC